MKTYKGYFWLGDKCETTQETDLNILKKLVKIAKQNPKIEYKIIEITAFKQS